MKNLKITVLTALFALMVMYSNAQIEGYWKGTISLGTTDLGVGFDIKADGDRFVSTMDVPAQGAFDLPVDAITF